MTSAVETVYLSNEDFNIAKIARDRDDYLRHEAYTKRRLKELTEENAELTREKEDLSRKNENLSKTIARLQAQLKNNGIDSET